MALEVGYYCCPHFTDGEIEAHETKSLVQGHTLNWWNTVQFSITVLPFNLFAVSLRLEIAGAFVVVLGLLILFFGGAEDHTQGPERARQVLCHWAVAAAPEVVGFLRF